MQTKTDTGSKNVIDLAKSTMHPISCEWKHCTAVMNSWNSLLKVSCRFNKSASVVFSCFFSSTYKSIAMGLSPRYNHLICKCELIPAYLNHGARVEHSTVNFQDASIQNIPLVLLFRLMWS
jgi:hypothetical protein